MKKQKDITAQIIGANIRRIRRKHGETQQQLGAFLGYGATTIANYFLIQIQMVLYTPFEGKQSRSTTRFSARKDLIRQNGPVTK